MATNKSAEPDTVQTEQAEQKTAFFRKSHILTFKRYANRRDLLKALLDDERKYTLKEVDGLIQNFMTPKKGKVK